ncbi:MAG: hypothetical protein HY675_18490, partial [Chloroflexi bacterium]|nr:hypothetical protein [Chloroflexota bacterium]
VSVLKRLAQRGVIEPDDCVVAYITGNGLKTQEAVIDKISTPFFVQPNIDSFEQNVVGQSGEVARVL